MCVNRGSVDAGLRSRSGAGLAAIVLARESASESLLFERARLGEPCRDGAAASALGVGCVGCRGGGCLRRRRSASSSSSDSGGATGRRGTSGDDLGEGRGERRGMLLGKSPAATALAVVVALHGDHLGFALLTAAGAG